MKYPLYYFIRIVFFYLLILIPVQLIFAQEIQENIEFSVFPVSSEMQIGKLQKFLIDAPKGIYFTVGA